jgi:hypothetical protein
MAGTSPPCVKIAVLFARNGSRLKVYGRIYLSEQPNSAFRTFHQPTGVSGLIMIGLRFSSAKPSLPSSGCAISLTGSF